MEPSERRVTGLGWGVAVGREGVRREGLRERSKPIDRDSSSRLLSLTPMPGHPRKRPKRTRLYQAAAVAGVFLCVAVPAFGGKGGSRPAAWMAVDSPQMPKGQQHTSRHQIDQLEDAWRNAILKSNTAVMDRLLGEDYLAITAAGLVQTKAQTLANLKSGRVHMASLNVSDRKVRFYGRTAVVTSLAAVQATTSEGDISGNYRYTRVYARDSAGNWKIVSFEASKIREQSEHK
jgi:ketosteroid isomerase-like protein